MCVEEREINWWVDWFITLKKERSPSNHLFLSEPSGIENHVTNMLENELFPDLPLGAPVSRSGPHTPTHTCHDLCTPNPYPLWQQPLPSTCWCCFALRYWGRSSFLGVPGKQRRELWVKRRRRLRRVPAKSPSRGSSKACPILCLPHILNCPHLRLPLLAVGPVKKSSCLLNPFPLALINSL